VSVFSFRRPHVDRATAGGPFSYPEVGQTRDGQLPRRYHHIEVSRVLGQGAATFQAARSALRDWAGHRAAGIDVGHPPPLLEPGQVVRLVVRVQPLWASLHDRIVWVLDEPGRFGFAYGTLAAHAERGEESFLVEHFDDDRVVLAVRAFSRQAHWLSRLGWPVARLVQARATRAYLDGVAAAVRDA
jgi:uncharacterized protein (UPF0548 family)